MSGALQLAFNAALDAEDVWPQAHQYALALLGMALTARARHRRQREEQGVA